MDTNELDFQLYAICAIGGIAWSYVFSHLVIYCYNSNCLNVQERLPIFWRWSTAPIARIHLSTDDPLPISINPQSLSREPMILFSPGHEQRIQDLNETRWNAFAQRFDEMRNAMMTREETLNIESDGSSESEIELGVTVIQDPLRICARSVCEDFLFDPLIVTIVLSFPDDFPWIKVLFLLWGVIRFLGKGNISYRWGFGLLAGPRLVI